MFPSKTMMVMPINLCQWADPDVDAFVEIFPSLMPRKESTRGQFRPMSRKPDGMPSRTGNGHLLLAVRSIKKWRQVSARKQAIAQQK
jgi:hypothetical protein